jgi:D-amino-acid dehydrogenase
MKIIVLGAGVIGTTSAWYLALAGHEVTVVDRQSHPGLETSFANGGQISVSHSEPWANPTAPFQILRWLGREDAPLLFRPRLERSQWLWGARFLLECLPARARRNTAQALALAIYSREQLHELRRETGIAYDAQTRGILHLYEERRELAHARAQVDFLRARGLDVSLKTLDECVALEPALKHAAHRFAGAAYARTDESGDASMFTHNLGELCRRKGVRFRFNVNVARVECEKGLATRVVLDDERGAEESMRADAYVFALGSYSPLLLRPMGIAIPVYPVKGYSITLPLGPADEAPYISLTDHSRKLVFSRLGERLRVAGTAELNGYDTEINAVRCRALVERCFELFPRAGRPTEAQSWTGLRPATPSNLPIVGRCRIRNVYLNTGHGTLGWTLSCGSGRALADIVSGRRPEPEFGFLGAESKSRGAAVSAAPRLTA